MNSLLRGFREEVEDVGTGSVSLMKAVDLIDWTDAAFDPRTAATVERACLSGDGTDLGWHVVGAFDRPDYRVPGPV